MSGITVMEKIQKTRINRARLHSHHWENQDRKVDPGYKYNHRTDNLRSVSPFLWVDRTQGIMLPHKGDKPCQLLIADARFAFSVQSGDRILLHWVLVNLFDRPFQVFPLRPHCQ